MLSSYTLTLTISVPKMKNLLFFSIFFLAISFQACQKAPSTLPYKAEKSLLFDSAAVVSPHPLASEVGASILQKGGNAVDAAIAVQFAMAVVYPRAGNLGGGGFMVIRTKNGQTDALDYREKAPAAASRDMYLDSLGNVDSKKSTIGHLAVGVPGTVAGMFAAHERYGKLPMNELISPAIELAQQGFLISETEAKRLNRFRPQFEEMNDHSIAFVPDDTAWSKADMLIQPELAKTLQRIRESGKKGFYEGETANLLETEMKKHNGLITKADLKAYNAQWRTPIQVPYKNYQIISMPPASSGGVALGQLMQIMEPYPIKDWGFHAMKTVHLMVEAERRVYADRAEHLGDMDFYAVPIDSLLNKKYLSSRMESFSLDTATASEAIFAGEFSNQMESFETTHTSVIDSDGNAVSVTTTINSNFGSKVVVEGAGFFLNNEMDDFSAKPGVPNQFGLVGAEANAIQPGKRMLSSMTPTIVEKDGDIFMVLGAPGGSTIITAVFQVILNVIEFDMELEEAVNACRFHHQWLPNEIKYEENCFTQVELDSLQAMGHKLKEVSRMAVIKAIHKTDSGKLHAVGDPRNPDDDVAGY